MVRFVQIHVTANEVRNLIMLFIIYVYVNVCVHACVCLCDCLSVVCCVVEGWYMGTGGMVGVCTTCKF